MVDTALSDRRCVQVEPEAPVRARRLHAPSRGVVYAAAVIALVAQQLWLLGFSTLEYRRGDLTFDFSTYNQARWLITRGDLDPYDTVLGFRYFDNHGEAIMWPLAELTRLPPHGLLLLFVQDLAVLGIGLVTLRWVLGVIAARSPAGAGWRPALVGAALTVILVANPWIYVSLAFDFHMETLGTFFAVLVAYDLAHRRRRRVWVWVVLCIACGDVAATYLVAVGVAGLVARGVDRRSAASVLAAGAAWLATLTALHANQGSNLVAGYGYLAVSSSAAPSIVAVARGAIAHPIRDVARVWSNRQDLWANLSASGLFGLLTPWAAVPVLIMLENTLHSGQNYSAPIFQSLPAYAFVALGTGLFLARLSCSPRRRCRWAAAGACAGVAALVVAWAVVWLPTYPGDWLRVSPAAAAVVDRAAATVPPTAEVVGSQGILGRFSDRRSAYAVPLVGNGSETVPVTSRPVYFVLTPSQGVEPVVQETETDLAEVAGPLGARLVLHGAGVWVFRWDPPSTTRSLTLPALAPTVDAWTLRSDAGHAVVTGPERTWHMAGDGRVGDVVYGDYWYLGVGHDLARVALDADGPVTVEVWNVSTGALLAQRSITGTAGTQTVEVPFTQPRPGHAKQFTGVPILRVVPAPPPPGQQIEVRVYDPGGTRVSVDQVSVARAPS